MTSFKKQTENGSENKLSSIDDSMNEVSASENKECFNSEDMYLHSCIQSWKQIFPWLQYVEDTKIFVCTVCEWGSLDPNLIEIMRLKAPGDLRSVAKRLRKHGAAENHKNISAKKEMLTNLCSQVYPLVKGFLQDTSSMKDVVNTLTELAGGNFPGPQEFPAKFAFTGFMIKRIADCIEENLLTALAESPYFSVFSHEIYNFAVIRWLNKKGESEEHLFCTDMNYSGQVESCTNYLAMNNINMNKLVSFSNFSKSNQSNIAPNKAAVPEVPIRCPPFELFLNWVEEATFMKHIFQQLNVITKLCKSYYHRFAGFPEIADLMSIEEPFSYNCLMNEKILQFFFDNLESLKGIAGEIHKKTKNMEAYGFSAVELPDIDSTKRCAFLFPKLCILVSSVFSESLSSRNDLENFGNRVQSRMKETENSNMAEYNLLTMVSIFLSHVMATVRSPGKKITEMLSKKMCNVTISDMEMLSLNLMKDYKGTNQDCLDMFKLLQSSISVNTTYSILELLDALHKRPDLQEKFKELCTLHKKIKVLPCYAADMQQSMFCASYLQFFLSKQVPQHLNHPMILIILEGPSLSHLNIDQVVDMWARRWKCGPDNKIVVPNVRRLVYPV